jgi:hypothetical protein
MSKLFDDGFMDDAIGVAALLVAVVISAFNWIEFFRGMV